MTTTNIRNLTPPTVTIIAASIGVEKTTGSARPVPVPTGTLEPHTAARRELDSDRAEVRVYETEEADPASGQYPGERDLALYRGASSREMESFVIFVNREGAIDARFGGQALPGGAVVIEVHRWRWSRWEVDIVHYPYGISDEAVEAVAAATRQEAVAFS